jgi:hypothetical protein
MSSSSSWTVAWRNGVVKPVVAASMSLDALLVRGDGVGVLPLLRGDTVDVFLICPPAICFAWEDIEKF